MFRRSHWHVAAGMLLVVVPCSKALAQSGNGSRLGVGQQVQIATHDGASLDGYVRAETDSSITLRVSGFGGSSIVTVARSEIDRAAVAVPQDYSERRALIGGAAGMAVGALAALALNKGQTCRAPGECWRIDFVPMTSAIGFSVGLLAGWFQRPNAWVPVKP